MFEFKSFKSAEEEGSSRSTGKQKENLLMVMVIFKSLLFRLSNEESQGRLRFVI
ncbi:hypothetical protein HanIR_Chr01g0042851 [Helianthus annuus]|nr:hypothetical protein HanIR_Chr01g0042851 [Helianthus annuus]